MSQEKYHPSALFELSSLFAGCRHQSRPCVVPLRSFSSFQFRPFDDAVSASRHRSHEGDDIHLGPHVHHFQVANGQMPKSHSAGELPPFHDSTGCGGGPYGAWNPVGPASMSVFSAGKPPPLHHPCKPASLAPAPDRHLFADREKVGPQLLTQLELVRAFHADLLERSENLVARRLEMTLQGLVDELFAVEVKSDMH